MTQAARIIGIPGAGKTTRAIDIIAKVRDRGFSLQEVGFCSFTRAARREAAQRACETFGVPLESLEREGWFRTIHSACARLLRLPRGCIVNFDLDWLRDALHDRDLDVVHDEEEDDLWVSAWKGKGPTRLALTLWDVARNRLCPLLPVYEEAQSQLIKGAWDFPDYDEVLQVIRDYEWAKKRDDRLDFSDILLRYAGLAMTAEGPDKTDPQGEIPPVPVWIFDEAQDTSPLLDKAARRLSDGCYWLYLFGDREQGIYGFGGANPNSFMTWPVAHEEYLYKTWRCARAIIDLGLELILRSDDLTKELRQLAVEARCPGGTIKDDHEESLCEHVDDAAKSTLIMARTNAQLKEIHGRLTDERIPWRSVKTGARWPLLTTLKLAQALANLQEGKSIDGEAFRRIVHGIPAQWLDRGTKQFYKRAESVLEVKDCCLASAVAHGCTPALVTRIATGAWARPETGVIKQETAEAYQAQKRWGTAVVANPPVQVSTIHGSKGLQADKVVLLTRINETIRRHLLSDEGGNEERRVWYVGATRARDELVLLAGRRPNYEEIYDCL